jgi:hypothetical protein
MIPPGYVSIRSAYTKVSQLNDRDAVGRLTFYLSMGQLQAFDFGKRGEKELIRAEFWQNIPEGIRRDIFEKGTGAITYTRIPFKEIVVLEDDLAKILSTDDNAISVDSMGPSSTNKAGRHPKYDWDYVWAGIVHEEGLPESQDKMIERVQLWYASTQEKAEAPSRSALQPLIKMLFAVMRRSEP